MRTTNCLWLTFALAGLILTPARAAEAVIHNFGNPPKGGGPYGGVIQDSTGNLYGTTTIGGTAGDGVVFKVDPRGHETVLHNFSGADGVRPAGLIQDSSGNLYGTAVDGGAFNAGVVFELNTTGNETVLYSFCAQEICVDGYNPNGGVIRDSSGNLYGTTTHGGASGYGVVYKLDTTGHETVLHSFTGGADGGNPYASLVADAHGNLYGTTYYGATAGVVFKVDTTGQETVLYSFTGGVDGGGPNAVTLGSDGKLYGTTGYGGASGQGIVYKLDLSGNETVLYSFTGGADGGNPFAGVIRASNGKLYGTTTYGGNSGAGVVYELSAKGQEKVLHSFTGGNDGAYPQGLVMRDSLGNLFDTTYSGGSGFGVVFELSPDGHETPLVSFPTSTDGFSPYAGVIGDSSGNLYGTASNGGPYGSGVVYQIDATGHETVLYSFCSQPNCADGSDPSAGVIRDSSGNLYGTTTYGGASGSGVVYKLDASGTETVLYSFTGGADGGNPQAGVIRDSAGNLYGTTNGGGYGVGVVYKVDTSGHETVLYTFNYTDGGFPYAGVIFDSSGNLYGTTPYGGAYGAGVVYKLDATGQETVLYSFTGGADGTFPFAGVFRSSDGNLFGTTIYGGAVGVGVVYKLDTAGNQTVLHSFTGGADGVFPYGGLIRDSTGNFYGTTQYGGAFNAGTVYMLDSHGSETVLYTFTGGADGSRPYAGVIRRSDGKLYGTTQYGGKKNGGVVFSFKP